MKENYSANTINQTISAVNSLIDFINLYENSEIPKFTKLKIKKDKVQKNIKDQLLTRNELIELSKYFPEQVKIACFIMFGAGLRISEVIKLTIDNFNIDGNFIEIQILNSKGKTERTTLLLDFQDEVMNYVTSCKNNKLFSINDNFIRNNLKGNFSDSVKNWQNNRNCNVTPHSLRHCYATNYVKKYISNGKDGMLLTLQILMGHENIEILQIYLHIDISIVKNFLKS